MALGQYLCIDNGSLIIKQLIIKIRLIKDVLVTEPWLKQK